MDRTKIGTLDVSSMGMGTLNWPLDKKEDPNAEAALRACIAKGVNLFDTAEAYGFGTSEILTRNCVAAVGAPAIIATKFAPVPWRRRPEDVVDACRASAARLGVEAIDLYQIHWPDIIQPFKAFGVEERKVAANLLRALRHLKDTLLFVMLCAFTAATPSHAADAAPSVRARLRAPPRMPAVRPIPRPPAERRPAGRPAGRGVLGGPREVLRAGPGPERGGVQLRAGPRDPGAQLAGGARRAARVQPDQLLAALPPAGSRSLSFAFSLSIYIHTYIHTYIPI